MDAQTEQLDRRALTEGQVWERWGCEWRVVHVGSESVNLRAVRTDQFTRVSNDELVRTFRYRGNPLSDEVVLFRVSDVLRRAGIDDAEILIEGIESLVRFRQVKKAQS